MFFCELCNVVMIWTDSACVFFFLCLVFCFYRVCFSEARYRGWAEASASHTCSSSNHRRQLRYPGLPSTRYNAELLGSLSVTLSDHVLLLTFLSNFVSPQPLQALHLCHRPLLHLGVVLV